jgi:CubicO group peptidase (beta-lactamase class C family)
MTIHGTAEPRFVRVREEFERNFAERDEVGASVCVTVDGETVVDLHGGMADPAGARTWAEDTVGVVWSCTKGATALCAHILVSRGLLDLDAPVARYWPEFAAAGKEGVTVRMALAHQAGVPAVRKPLAAGAFGDWDLVTGTIAAEAPFWEPGTRHGYHAFTFGWLIGEIVQRVSGRPFGRFFAEEVAGPLGLDFHIGLPATEEARVAPTIPAAPPDPATMARMWLAAFTDPTSIPAMVLANSGGYLEPGAADTPAMHAAVIPAAGGITNARGLARMYRPLALGGSYDGVRLVQPKALPAMQCVVSATSVDATLLVPTRWSAGFNKAIDNRGREGERDSVLVSEEAFGHPGMGGSVGFADPGARMSFGYTMNRQGTSLAIDDRAQSLIDAVYQALGYCDAPGGWVR